MADQWYYSQDGSKRGPVSDTELKQLAAGGQLLPTDLVWKEGMSGWVPASSLKEVFPAPPGIPRSAAKGSGRDRGGRDDYDDRDDDGSSTRRNDASGVTALLRSITATELGVSSTVLGGITIFGQTYPLLAAGLSALMGGGGSGSAMFFLVIFILFTMLAGFLGLIGLIMALRRNLAGATYCIVGMCVSLLAFITNISIMFALSDLVGRWR